MSSLHPHNKNTVDNEEFYEWLRGYTDAEGYFLISEKLAQSGVSKPHRSFSFSFIIHLSKKEKETLDRVHKLLGGIGTVKVYGEACFFRVTSSKDIDQLLSVMR